jgi:3',5'-cyclic-AMP phosphodiesterase
VRDVPGLRIVVFDSTIKGSHRGTYRRLGDDVVGAVAEAAPTPVLVLTHHQPQPLPLPHHWPPGIPSPEANAFLARLSSANPNVWLSSGHTHRHRRTDRRGVVVTEVGSTHDYPGTWAGYVVHEGGLRQVVRRIAEPGAVRWLEATGRTFFGIWGRWAPGRLADRCVSHTWATR